MNRVVTIFIICLLGFIPFDSIAQERTKKIDRIINKQIAKVWRDQAIIQTPINTSLDIEFDLFFADNELHRLDEAESTVGFLLLRRGFGCKIGGCGGAGDQGEGQICSADGNAYEYFDYIILFDNDLSILKIAVVDYPGDYGYEITSKGWLKQFNGYKGAKMRYGKEVDAISGATISANSLTKDVVDVYKMMSYFIIEKSLVAVK